MATLNILYEDPHILVCVKPHGIATQSKSIRYPDMVSLIRNHLAKSSGSRNPGSAEPYLAVIHRLDQPVSGILVFARTPAAAKDLNQQLQNGQFEKYYQAVVCGTLPDSGTLTDYLVKDGRTNTSRICSKNTPGAKKAVLSYEILETSEVTGLSVVQIRLGTGRHHQIRVQMAGAGAPLWGDNKYNPEFVNKRGYFPIALRAFRLSFCHPATGKRMEFEVPCNWEQLETKAD